jgi:hypothetical protein
MSPNVNFGFRNFQSAIRNLKCQSTSLLSPAHGKIRKLPQVGFRKVQLASACLRVARLRPGTFGGRAASVEAGAFLSNLKKLSSNSLLKINP